MITYTRYASRTGRILDVVVIPADAYDYNSTLLYEGVVDGETHYIVDGEPTQRPAQATTIDKTEVLADGTDVVTITEIPSGSTLSITGPVTVSPQQIDDGSAELVFDVPGDYTVRVECFPWLPWEAAVHAG